MAWLVLVILLWLVYQGTRWMDEEERWLNRRELREKAWKEIAKLNHRW